MDEQDILTFKLIAMPNGLEFRLVVWEDGEVKEIYEALPSLVKKHAVKMINDALGTWPVKRQRKRK